MIRLLLTIACFVSLFSCTNNSDDLPDCIQQKIEESKLLNNFQLRGVYRLTKSGNDFYWFKTGAVEVDGSESIYNEDCTFICNYCGFCIQQECIKDFPSYGSDQWKEVWKP